ncbi:MAG: replication and repair protein RecF protein [candidate division CPR3 bacterium GW2011_GWE2_35_7]|uniref:DNA replication and repair protein RecF n=1 Tax=candidate division CPR3 bacterium GW2011_GWF2_35_18 TaxID=1618350 RepID=A0A0G0ER79_UNCC3|nr:MAG: replication and repair protein RecF protein [candidate division CPR3 bacterium GW2011_GWF2_35_18]KKP87257.1 MAG: replication and repair protein RecF protein [candidate division CPR3 bacterium GW2011_GWE2_35_7]
MPELLDFWDWGLRMRLNKVLLSNFRNFKKESFDFQHTTIILADNTHGKTNLLEAIFYLSTGKSFRAENEIDVINYDKDFASIEGEVENTEGKEKLRVFISGQEHQRKQLRVNGINRMISNFSGRFRSVIFTPENFNILQGSPEIRRRYLDNILIQIDREYVRNLSQYRKVVYQRNRLLESIRERKSKENELDYWNEKLLELGRFIQERRFQLISFLNDELLKYSFLYRSKKQITLVYKNNLVSEERLFSHAQKEIAAGLTLIGPHRDEMLVFLDGKKIESFGSRGEQRLGILSLSLSAIDFIEYCVKERPILLLDDIFSELDSYHKSSVQDILEKQQSIITTTEWENGVSKKVQIIEL